MSGNASATITIEEKGTGRRVLIPVSKIHFAECSRREKKKEPDYKPYPCRNGFALNYGDYIQQQLKKAGYRLDDGLEKPASIPESTVDEDDINIEPGDSIPELFDENIAPEQRRSISLLRYENKYEYLLRIGLGHNRDSVIEFVYPDEDSRDAEAAKIEEAFISSAVTGSWPLAQ